MRTDRRYTRVRDMLRSPEVPRLEGGGIALCHGCQRSVYFAGGFIRLLAMALEKQASCRGSVHWSVKRNFRVNPHGLGIGEEDL
jgi:hypothetical protein